MSKNNGGFPPIKYCPANEKIDTTQSSVSKERLFSAPIKKNINIREILKTSDNKPVIDLNIKSDELEDL
jgi:hypothetical protein